MKTIIQISAALVEHLRKHHFVQAYHELFSEDAESVDPLHGEHSPIRGLNKLITLETQFLNRSAIHEIQISDAVIAGTHFCIRLAMRFTTAGAEKTIDELCVYQVSAGKIISQQFFIS